MIIGCILIGTAIWLAYETKGLLIGESANKRVVDGIKSILNSYSMIEHINEVLTMHMGPNFILVNISVDFNDHVTAHDVETTIAEIDRKIKAEFSNLKRVFVETESRINHLQENI